MSEIERLEAIAFRAWPSAVVHAHKGMLLRATGGESRRANSGALHACDEELSPDEAISVAEAFYKARESSAQFQVGPRAPAGLDAALASRGYGIAALVCVQTAALSEVARRSVGRARSVRAEVHATPDAEWIDVEVTRGRYADIADIFVRLMIGVAPRAGFAVAHVDGTLAAACLAVCDDDVLVLAAMPRPFRFTRRSASRHATRTTLRAAFRPSALS